MCGLCGIVRPGGVEAHELETMLSRLVHRGPDDAGVYRNGSVGLGHRRLSIIDVDHGRQPLANEDDSVWVVLNGEIYNYRELRADLIAKGHRFRTRTDTEVIVHLYEEVGDACVQRLRGMFAFALWDARRQRLLAARDRFGQKPFFYVQRGQELLFASEIKALLALDSSLARPDAEALDEYLALRVITPPRTMFRDVRKLPPAHLLRLEGPGRLSVERYWEMAYEPKHTAPERVLVDRLETELVECLRLHVVSDVPIGAFLSGGLDSTLVVALLARHVLDAPFETFSGSLDYGSWDEAPAARSVAERYGTRHHERVVTPSLLELLPRLIWHLDEPSDPLAVCTWRIAELAREHVKVALGGDGGDELFGGYDRYYGQRYAGAWALLPEPVRRHLFGPWLDRLAGGGWYKSRAHQLKWLQQLSFFEGGERYARSLGYFYFDDAQRRALRGPGLAAALGSFDPYASIRQAWEDAPAEHPIDRMLHADARLRLPDHSVMILDRMSMAHGLEARSPLLDHVLAEFCARLPVDLKVRGRSLRRIEMRLAERHLPREVLTRPKQGFASALPYMLRDEYALLQRQFLREARLARDELLRQDEIDRLLAEHVTGRADHGNRLWLLLNAELWYRTAVGGAGTETLEAEIATARRDPAAARVGP